MPSWWRTLFTPPEDYVDTGGPVLVASSLPKHDVVAENKCYEVTVVGAAVERDVPRRRLELAVRQGPFKIMVAAYGGDPDYQAWKALVPGEIIRLYGSLQNWNGQMQMTGPVLVPIQCGQIYPMYGRQRYQYWHRVDQCLGAPPNDIDGDLGVAGLPSERELLQAAKLQTDQLWKVFIAAHRAASVEEGTRGQRALRRLHTIIDGKGGNQGE